MNPFASVAGVPVEALLDAIDAVGFDAELLEARDQAGSGFGGLGFKVQGIGFRGFMARA